MVVIIDELNGKPVFNDVKATNEEKQRAELLDERLAVLAKQIEVQWMQKKEKTKRNKIDMTLVLHIAGQLADVVDDRSLAAENERPWIWKAMRNRHFQHQTFGMRGKTRDDLEYLYQINGYPKDFILKISWDSWKRLLDSPSVREDKRFKTWIRNKTKKLTGLSRSLIRTLLKELFASLKKKDTSVLTEGELFALYDAVWRKVSMGV